MLLNSTRPCYTWNGSQTDYVYTPCNLAAAHSMCCPTLVKPGEKTTPTSCLPNGLCSDYFNDIRKLSQQRYWIGACSDRSWQVGVCAGMARYFKPAPEGLGCYTHENGIVPLGFCPDTKKYCCNRSVRKLNAECCDPSIPENVILDDLPTASMIAVTTSYAGFLATTALPTMASATASATATPRLSSPSTSTAADAGKSSGLTVGAGVGVGAGVASGFFLLLIGIAFLRLRRGGRGRVVAPAELSGTQVHELR